MTTTTTYVAYQHAGIILSEESVKPVDVRDPQRQANDAPNDTFAFFYFDIVSTIVDVDGKSIETSSGRLNITGTYYIDAELMMFDQVEALPDNNSTLLSNMRDNGWSAVVRCRTGNTQPFSMSRDELLTTS